MLDPKERPIRTLTPEKDDKPFIQGDPTAQVRLSERLPHGKFSHQIHCFFFCLHLYKSSFNRVTSSPFLLISSVLTALSGLFARFNHHCHHHHHHHYHLHHHHITLAGSSGGTQSGRINSSHSIIQEFSRFARSD